MVNKPKGKGTFAESTVVTYLQGHGFRWAERRALKGAEDWGDVTGTPGLVWEVKYANGGIRMAEWIEETCTERENAGADHGILVIKPNGLGDKKVHLWFAAMVAWDFDKLAEKVTTSNVVFSSGPPQGFIGPRLAMDFSTVQVDAAPGEIGIPVLLRRPPGTQDMPQLWYRVMRLQDVVTLVRVAGYGDPI